MWGRCPPPKRRPVRAKPPSLGSVCVYILILPTQNLLLPKEVPVQSLIIFISEYIFMTISEEEKVSSFSMKK